MYRVKSKATNDELTCRQHSFTLPNVGGSGEDIGQKKPFTDADSEPLHHSEAYKTFDLFIEECIASFRSVTVACQFGVYLDTAHVELVRVFHHAYFTGNITELLKSSAFTRGGERRACPYVKVDLTRVARV